MLKQMLYGFILASVLTSCKKETEKAVSETQLPKVSGTEVCYLVIFKNDTISMQLKIKGNQLTSGNLSYHRFQKDKNEGTLVGELKGDTLLAVYTFKSEGMTSVRDVAFLKKGTTYTEGFGESIDDNSGKVIFKDPKTLRFDPNTILSKVVCP